MNRLPRRLSGFTLFINGRDKGGLITAMRLPQLSVRSEGYRSGGMDMPVPIMTGGMEMMEAEITLAEYDVQVMQNIGNQSTPVQMEAKGVARLNSVYQTISVKITGYITTIPGWDWTAGETNPTMSFTTQLNYYAIDIDGVNIIEIDPVNMKRVINGQDQLEFIRLFLFA